jgi:deoxyribonuclease-4
MLFGAHIRTSDGLAEVPTVARRIGCDVLQIFSKSPQIWKAAPIPDELARSFVDATRRESIRSVAVHHAYLTNLASSKPTVLAQSRRAFLDDLQRAEKLGAQQLIFHPGSHAGVGAEAGLAQVADRVNEALNETTGFRVQVLFENSAGQGTALCGTVRELALLLDRITDRRRVGVAIDTCHVFASGLDFRADETYGTFVDGLESELGSKEVRAFHLNDSKGELGSRLDRHENIGNGRIGAEGFRRLVNDRRWDEIPGYLETPLDETGYDAYERDLRTLRSLLTVPAETVVKAARAAMPRRNPRRTGRRAGAT